MEPFFKYLRDHYPTSANSDQYPEVTFKSAGLLIPQLKRLVHRMSNHRLRIRKVKEFHDDRANRLLELLEKNGSDKGNRHHYYYIYYMILNNLGIEKDLRVFEIGLGTNNPVLVSTMGKEGVPGASLRAFRDYLPNANIFGADIDRDILISENRITTAYVDQLEAESFDLLPFLDKPFDLIIDDGLHSVGANINSLIFALDHVKEGGWIVIEDIHPRNVEVWHTVDQIIHSSNEFNTSLIQCRKSCLYVLHKNLPAPI